MYVLLFNTILQKFKDNIQLYEILCLIDIKHQRRILDNLYMLLIPDLIR